jgi:hypothetical protein
VFDFFLPQTSKTRIQMQKRFLRYRGHRVPVQGQESQLVDPGEGLFRQRSNQVEAEIENLKVQI